MATKTGILRELLAPRSKKKKKRKGPEERARHRGREIPVDANAGYAREAAKSNHAKTREWSSFLYARAARHTPDK